MSGANHPTSNPVDLLRRIQLSIDGFARGERVSTWVNTELLKEARAEIERLDADAANEKAEKDSLAAILKLRNAEIARLTRERDEWAAKWHRLRAELAELKYPGMKGVVRPLSGEHPPSETKADGVLPDARLIRSPLFQQFMRQGFWHAHHVDLVWRYNGQDVREEADWLKDVWYALRPSEKASDV